MELPIIQNSKIGIGIDEEWANFISPNYEDISDDDNYESNINFALNNNNTNSDTINNINNNNQLNIINNNNTSIEIPKASNIYISTKSKIAYLDQEIDLKTIFWKIPVLPYATPSNGVIKKQIKFNSTCQEELDIIQENIKSENFCDQHIITSINNPNGRIKFKDIRKVSIGISKKDLMSYRCKKKSAFYNCFVMILRIKINDLYKEFHIKVFNTGKLEIPGIQTDYIFEQVLLHITQTIQPFLPNTLGYKQVSDTVLINSNFNCGFYINREILFDILKFNYNIQCIYDPCSYPGIQCKFYYNPNLSIQTGSQISDEDRSIYTNITTVSFMIFRTGSLLIVGMCDEHILYAIYEFLKTLLIAEFHKINQKVITAENTIIKEKKKKIRRKTIIVTIPLLPSPPLPSLIL